MPTILLAHEDTGAREALASLILGFFPTARIQPVSAWDQLEPALAGAGPSSVLLADIFWENVNRAAELVVASEHFPEVFFAWADRPDLAGGLPGGCPIPVAPDDEGFPLRLAEWTENLSGREIGPYVITAPAGPHLLGRLYWAKHHQLQRSVQLLVPPAGCPRFAPAIRALARINHPSVFSLYESLPWENRMVVALEPVLHPTLLHLRLAGLSPDLIACAHLATALASVLAEMESSLLPARRLGEYDYTLSPQGVARLRNPAAFPGMAPASHEALAEDLSVTLSPHLQDDPRGTTLLQILRHPGASAADFLQAARDFEHQLAEIREIRIRKEEREAEEKTRKAWVIRRWAIGVGAVGLLAYLAVFTHTLFRKILLDLPGRLPEVALPVPAGPIQVDGEIRSVEAFSLDRHEVTIGEYEKFLEALRADPGWITSLPETTRRSKSSPADFEPRDWPEILRRARKNDFYQDQKISRDTPVFNLDYPCAAAYAHWKGRRLPTMEEWMRAAGGDDGRLYPWGNSADPSPANLGIRRDITARTDPGDSFFNAAAGESFSGDRGPFGHLDLGGNVSEWATGPFQKPVALGGNFTDVSPIPVGQSRRRDQQRNEPPPDTRLEMIGFRTAR